MKLRIRGNSIRLRLTRPEVDQLVARGVVEEETRFPDGGVLRYRLVADAAAAEPGTVFREGVLTVKLPTAAIERWARETVVGLEHSTPLSSGGELTLLVEKDFECRTPKLGENDEGTYPNPDKHGNCEGT